MVFMETATIATDVPRRKSRIVEARWRRRARHLPSAHGGDAQNEGPS
jgi:hypothetical protein